MMRRDVRACVSRFDGEEVGLWSWVLLLCAGQWRAGEGILPSKKTPRKRGGGRFSTYIFKDSLPIHQKSYRLFVSQRRDIRRFETLDPFFFLMSRCLKRPRIRRW